MKTIYQWIEEYKNQGTCLLASVMDGNNAGEKMLFCDGKEIYVTPGAALLPANQEILCQMKKSERISLEGQQVFVEIFGGTPQLVICGAGHVSMPIIQIGKSIGFEVTVLEDRPMFADQARRMGADHVLCESFEKGLASLDDNMAAYYVIVTRGHRYDTMCLREILKKKHAYVGMMGSRRRVSMVKQQLEEEGTSRALLETVHTPIGLAINAETPEEIAVSIMAEIIQCKNTTRKTEGYRNEILDQIKECEKMHLTGVIAEIVERKGSGPRSTGTKMFIRKDGVLTGTIGGGCLEAKVIDQARQMMAAEQHHVLDWIDMTSESAEEEGMVCGGTQLIYWERI